MPGDSLREHRPPDGKEVDTLFASLDEDGGGELDMKELKASLKKMMAAHANRKALTAAAMAKVAAKREQATALKEGSIAAAVRASEEAVARLEALRKKSSIDSQLGDAINNKGLKASDVATKWDASGDGELDKKEVRYRRRRGGVCNRVASLPSLLPLFTLPPPNLTPPHPLLPPSMVECTISCKSLVPPHRVHFTPMLSSVRMRSS